MLASRARHRHAVPAMRLALVGGRRASASEDGVERTLTEVGERLADEGHDVVAYGPTDSGVPDRGIRFRARAGAGVLAGAAAARRADVAVLLRASDVPLLPLLRARGTAVAVHLDADPGASRAGRLAERFAVREADAVVADTHDLADRVSGAYGVPTERIAAGTRLLRNTPADALEPLGLVPGGFHLLHAPGAEAADLEVATGGHRRSAAALPLVVVGPPAPAHPAGTGRVRMLGPVDDARLLDQLHAHALSAVHVRPSTRMHAGVLRSMGAGTAVVAWDAPAHRELVGTAGLYFRSAPQLAALLEEVERYPFRFADIGELMHERAAARHDWDSIAEAYAALAARLVRGYSIRGIASGRPIRHSPGRRRTERPS